MTGMPVLKAVVSSVFITVLTALPAVAASGAATSDPPLFLPVVTYGSGENGAHSIAPADMNANGNLNLAITNSDSNTVGMSEECAY